MQEVVGIVAFGQDLEDRYPNEISDVKFLYVNIRGLTDSKYTEIASKLKENEIIMLTETQLKIDKLKHDDGVIRLNSMRDMQDKKGGGLEIIVRKDFCCKLEYAKINTHSKDILHVKMKIGPEIMDIILVYFLVNKKENEKVNRETYNEISRIVRSCQDKLILLGDFNGHLSELGHHVENFNGRIVKDLMNDNDLTLMNMDPMCEGLYTWQMGTHKSVIDYVLVNGDTYGLITEMKIDEECEIFDLSDHKMISLNLKIKHKKKVEEGIIKRRYISTKPEDLNKFRNKIEEVIAGEEDSVTSIPQLNQIIDRCAKETLQKTYTKKKINQKIEPPWMNREIKLAIERRQYFNRNRRIARNILTKEHLNQEYLEQKNLVQRMVNKAITNHEIKKTVEIRNDSSRKKMWQNINKLRGKENNENNQLYDETKKIIENQSEIKEKIFETWRPLYQKEENEIHMSWNLEERENYVELLERNTFNIEVENENIEIPINLREHYEMAFNIGETINPMSKIEIHNEDIERTIRRMKNKKAAGPDGIKIEIYKEVIKIPNIRDLLTKLLQNILEGQEVPDSWKKSITKLIPKTSKPTAKDFRPIALTDNTYKICCSVIKDHIEEHILRRDLHKDQQNGFIKNRRIEDNLTIINFCVNYTFRTGQKLFLASIDYSKAFDSINRRELINVLKYYKMHPEVIDLIVRIYDLDSTELFYGDINIGNISIKNGIRQGCTVSALLFRLATYIIITELEKRPGFKFRDFRVNCLFFADDSIIIEKTEEDLRRTLDILSGESSKLGLEINKNKSKILIFNSKEQPQEIQGIPVVNSLKYLGITLGNSRNIYEEHKKVIIQKAQRMANLTHAIIHKSVNKVIIGTTYWKQVILPSILYGSAVIVYNKEDILKLQRIENSVHRKILGAQRFAPIVTLRGEVGASLMESRIMREKVTYLAYATNSPNEILKRVIQELRDGRFKWYTQIEDYMNQLKIEQIQNMSKEDIKQKVYELDTERWKKEMEELSSINVYKRFKHEINQYPYQNSPKYNLLYKMRSNTLNLEIRKRHVGGPTLCKLCESADEDMNHFLIHCRSLATTRQEIRELQSPVMEDEDYVIGDILFREVEMERRLDVIARMWNQRGKIIEELEEAANSRQAC